VWSAWVSIHDKKAHAACMDLVVPDAHTLTIPELGLTMADGGEKVPSSGKIVGK
jgi:hypothetical protein